MVVVGDLYLCGCGGSDYVSGDRLRNQGDCATAEMVIADRERVTAALRSLQAMTSLGDQTPAITQACMRPCTPDALPVMGSIPGYLGAYISAGHNCWGILWAPVSGLAMAELMMEGSCKVISLTAFDPIRYMQPTTTGRGRKKVHSTVGEQW